MYKMLIDGELVDSHLELGVINPATGQVFATCARAEAKHALAAIAGAKRAFSEWSALSYAARRSYLETLATALEDNIDELAVLLTKEQGKPLAQSRNEIIGSAYGIRHFASQTISDRLIRETESELILEQRYPLGVVAAITPWNFPLILLALKAATALIVGNTVVAKPAPTTPLIASKFAEIASKILPPGVFNLIIDNNDLGDLLTSHPDISKVTFTGSSGTGKKVMRSGSDTLKRITLELGGNDAAIVLDDANIRDIAPQLYTSAIFNAGQVCLASKRIYVHASQLDELCSELVKIASADVVGDGLDEATTIGPIQNEKQFSILVAYLESFKDKEKILCGGASKTDGGYFVEPTVLVAEEGDPIVSNEQFGPIIPVVPYDDLDRVIEDINAGPYGLAGSIWTSDGQRGIDIASRIKSGTIWVNKWLDTPFDIPLRGARESGIGAENGVEGLYEFTQARIINAAK